MADEYPFCKYNYRVVIADMGNLDFQEVESGILLMEPIEYREEQFTKNTTMNNNAIGNIDYRTITCKKGATDNKKLIEWFNGANTKTIDPKDVNIIALDAVHTEEKASWTLYSAFPIKIVLTDIHTTTHELAIEQLTLGFDSIYRAK